MSRRARSSSPYSYRRTPSSSTTATTSSSSTSSFFNSSVARFIPRSAASTTSSAASVMASYGGRSPVRFDDLLSEPLDAPATSSAGDSISVTVRFRPLNDREYQRGDERSWYPDGDKMVRCEYNPATAYAFDKVFGKTAATEEVYDVAARPVVKSAMEGVNGTVFAYGVTSSGKTHTMHGDQSCPGIIRTKMFSALYRRLRVVSFCSAFPISRFTMRLLTIYLIQLVRICALGKMSRGHMSKVSRKSL